MGKLHLLAFIALALGFMVSVLAIFLKYLDGSISNLNPHTALTAFAAGFLGMWILARKRKL